MITHIDPWRQAINGLADENAERLEAIGGFAPRSSEDEDGTSPEEDDPTT